MVNCSKCGIEFEQSPSAAAARIKTCNECRRPVTNAWSAANRERIKERNKRYYERKKEGAISVSPIKTGRPEGVKTNKKVDFFAEIWPDVANPDNKKKKDIFEQAFGDDSN